MKINNPGYKSGYTPITKMNELPWDDPNNTLMDFGVLCLKPHEKYDLKEGFEKAVLLLQGEIVLNWNIPNRPIYSENLKRNSYFDEDPWCLLAPSQYQIEIVAGDSDAELIIMQTKNDKQYPPMFFKPEDCRSELRGKGTMRETSTRVVRTIFDKNNAPESNLVLGEVINYPGKWSSYPPHGHAQPEIYHYRFLPKEGFGLGMMGYDDVACVHDGDTTIILDGKIHSQTAAPGYAMYYIWAIRHLENNPYGPVDFDPEHAWVMDDSKDGRIWPKQ